MSNCCYSAFSPRTSELTTDARMRPAPRPGPHWPQGLATRRRGLRTAKRKDEGEMTQTRQPSPAQPSPGQRPCLACTHTAAGSRKKGKAEQSVLSSVLWRLWWEWVDIYCVSTVYLHGVLAAAGGRLDWPPDMCALVPARTSPATTHLVPPWTLARYLYIYPDSSVQCC